jgi:hypothetical protein
MAIISNGTTIADAGAFSVNLGSMVHIKTLTASSSSTLSFVHGASSVVLDSTYPIYKFEFINIHPSADDSSTDFVANYSVDSGSNYNVSQTSTFFGGYSSEGGGGGIEYYPALDAANETNAGLIDNAANDNEASTSGSLFLFSPSNTNFVKHWIGSFSVDQSGTLHFTYPTAYINSTSAVNAVQFKFLSGNIDSGKIKLYGIKDS